jgi:hypothetical protein
MEDEVQPPLSLLFSSCYTPCSGDNAHVVPRWRQDQRRIFTTYRCGNCWIQSLDETRAAVRTGDADVVSSFCDFIERQGYTDVDVIRSAPPAKAKAYLLTILDAVQDGSVVFDP